MAKIDEKAEGAVAQAQSNETPEEKAWTDGVSKKYGIDPSDKEALYKAAREGYDSEHELNKKNRAANENIYNAIQESPEVAGLINGMTDKDKYKYPEEAIAELGEDLVDLLTGKIDNAKYREAKEKKLAEKEKADAKAKADAEEVGKNFEEACTEVGADPVETFEKIKQAYGDGREDNNIFVTKPFLKALIKSLSYDDDIAAAEVRGRSEASAAPKDRRGSDGIARSASAGGAVASSDPNSFNAYIQQKARMNR